MSIRFLLLKGFVDVGWIFKIVSKELIHWCKFCEQLAPSSVQINMFFTYLRHLNLLFLTRASKSNKNNHTREMHDEIMWVCALSQAITLVLCLPSLYMTMGHFFLWIFLTQDYNENRSIVLFWRLPTFWYFQRKLHKYTCSLQIITTVACWWMSWHW